MIAINLTCDFALALACTVLLDNCRNLFAMARILSNHNLPPRRLLLTFTHMNGKGTYGIGTTHGSGRVKPDSSCFSQALYL